MPLTPVYVEQATGDTAAPELEKQHGGVTKDVRLTNYLGFVGKRLLPFTKRKDVTHKFQVLDSDKIVNAFALGNGNVYATRGLLNILNDEAELAEVVGHELAHVDKRHIGAQIDAIIGVSGLLALAEGIYAARKHDKVSEGSQQFIDAANQLIPSLVVNGFSREHELEADDTGLKFAVSSGYDPQGSIRVFKRFQEMEPEVKGIDIFLQSHPTAKTRISDLEQTIMQKYPKSQGETYYDRYQSVVFEGGSLDEQGQVKGKDGIPLGVYIAGGVVLTAGAIYAIASSV